MKKKNHIESFVYTLIHSPIQKAIALFIMFTILISSVILVTSTTVKVKLLPKPLADNFTIYVDLPEGKSVYETKEVTSCILKYLKNEEIITNMSVFYGESAPVDFSAMLKGRLFDNGENIANILVNLKREHARDETSIHAVHRIRAVINEGCTLHDNKIKMVESPAGPPTLSSIVLEVTGDGSYKGLERLAYQVETIFKKIPKLVDIDVVNDEIYLKYNIVLSNHKIIQSNLQVEQVEKILYLAFEGMDIAYINDANAQNQIPIHLGLSKESKSLKVASKEYLQHKLSGIMLLNSKGMGVPLGEVVEIKTQKSNHKIISKNLSPLISVIAETDMESQIYPLLIIRDEIKNNLSKQYEIEDANFLDFSLTDKETKEKYLLHWDGEQKLSMDTLIDLGMALGVAIVLIYFMMVIYYNSFLLAGAISLASFISVAGVIYAHLAYNLFTPTTFYLTGTSLIGFIALIGINSRNSLLVIDFAQQLIEEQGLSVPRAIAVSIQTRAKPILLTVLAIIFASMLLATDPVFGGLGIALIGGTLAAYAVSIFIVPIIIYKPLLKQYPTKANESK